jgi:hypothetical protein
MTNTLAYYNTKLITAIKRVLVSKYYNRVEVTDNEKHSSLLRTNTN